MRLVDLMPGLKVLYQLDFVSKGFKASEALVQFWLPACFGLRLSAGFQAFPLIGAGVVVVAGNALGGVGFEGGFRASGDWKDWGRGCGGLGRGDGVKGVKQYSELPRGPFFISLRPPVPTDFITSSADLPSIPLHSSSNSHSVFFHIRSPTLATLFLPGDSFSPTAENSLALAWTV